MRWDDLQKLKNSIKALVLDVDGTLTDGKVYVGESGELFKAFNVKDGFGISQILPNVARGNEKIGIIPIIITGRTSPILWARCKELNIKYVFQGVDDKVKKLKDVLEVLNIPLNHVAYMGDDLNDLECMTAVGVCACPNDAEQKIKEISDYVCCKNGGEGAVREFINWLTEGRVAQI